MSRLDDELKIAFKRQEPSADFAAHVLARLNEAPAPQARLPLWQRLAGVFALPRLGWAAAGAMALLLIIIGITMLRAQRSAGVYNDRLQAAASSDTPASSKQGADHTAAPDRGTNTSTHAAGTNGNQVPTPRAVGSRKPIEHHVPAIAGQPKPSAEAEAAKEKVLFALQITSETLNDAQRAISDDRRDNEKPEPVQNR